MNTDSCSLLSVWARIVSELALHQDMAPKAVTGQVVNPIMGSVCTQETAFAAKVFATEYNRTEDEKWLARAKVALMSLHDLDISSGLSDPMWDVLGWHEWVGGLFTTGAVLDAVWETMRLLGIRPQKENYKQILDFLEGCLHSPGRFTHNTVIPGYKPGDSQNTTAIALYLLEYAVHEFLFADHSILEQRDRALHHLLQGQRPDGFWPYFCPNWLGRLGFVLPVLKHVRGIRRHFDAVDFGDAMHHSLVLYYLIKAISLSGMENSRARVGIARGWDWITKHLLPGENGSLQLDWSWEPIPWEPRSCNFGDTNCYFLILASLPLLARQRIISKASFLDVASGLCSHIEKELFEQEGIFPSIKPHERSIEIRRNILPCVEESVAWKGALLAEFVLAEDIRG